MQPAESTCASSEPNFYELLEVYDSSLSAGVKCVCCASCDEFYTGEGLWMAGAYMVWVSG